MPKYCVAIQQQGLIKRNQRLTTRFISPVELQKPMLLRKEISCEWDAHYASNRASGTLLLCLILYIIIFFLNSLCFPHCHPIYGFHQTIKLVATRCHALVHSTVHCS